MVLAFYLKFNFTESCGSLSTNLAGKPFDFSLLLIQNSMLAASARGYNGNLYLHNLEGDQLTKVALHVEVIFQ